MAERAWASSPEAFVFWKTTSPILHIVLLIAVIVPAVVLVEQWLSGPLMDRDIAVGGYLYKDPAMRKFVASVANLDVKKVREQAPRVDVNAPGENGVTPLKFAIDRVDDSGDKPERMAARLDMIRLLLTVGAKPDRRSAKRLRLEPQRDHRNFARRGSESEL
jgi:hypothetical protein